MINELEGETREVLRVVHRPWDVWKSTTRYNTLVDRDDRIALIIN
jgi:hypothetical protein